MSKTQNHLEKHQELPTSKVVVTFKTRLQGPREVSQWVRALALSEDPSSISSTHMVAHNYLQL